MLQYDGALNLALEVGEMSMGKLKYKTAHFMLSISNKGARCGLVGTFADQRGYNSD